LGLVLEHLAGRAVAGSRVPVTIRAARLEHGLPGGRVALRLRDEDGRDEADQDGERDDESSGLATGGEPP
jgi:hypothetical protein